MNTSAVLDAVQSPASRSSRTSLRAALVPELGRIALGCLCLVGTNAFSLAIPWLLKHAIDTLRTLPPAEAHGIVVDYDIFRNVRPPDPRRPHAVYEIGDMDFTLRPRGAAVDAGCRLPNLNDDFTGKAPDLGALEVGRATPVYGPRVAP